MTRTSWHKLWQERRLDFAALSVILLFFVVFFWPVIASGKFFVTSDGLVYSYPLRTVVWDRLRHGQLPLWTPLIQSGYPLLSMAQIGIGYPLTWGYLFLPGYLAEEIYNLAPYIFFPAFTYAYIREIGRSRLAALLGALSFAYGGAMISAVAYNGMLTNALMWLPLMLIALERVRKRSFVNCLLFASGAYAMSVLTGIGQGFLIAGMVALAYGLFLGLASRGLANQENDAAADMGAWFSWKRWRPLAVALGAVMIAAGVSAFQILETMRAQRRSIRNTLTYEVFTEGSYSPLGLLRSFLMPLHYIVDASAYIAPLAFVLAVTAVILVKRKGQRDVRVAFWFVVAISALVLMVGGYTPLFHVLRYVPILNLFRVPGRHAFEWTFAVAVLSAYGWDAVRDVLSASQRKAAQVFGRRQILTGLGLLLLSIAVIVLWHADIARVPIGEDVYYVRSKFPVTHYLAWKAFLTVFSLVLVWVSWRVENNRWRAGLLLGLMATASFAEPSIKASRWWWPTLRPAGTFSAASPTTRFLKNYPPEQNRIYTRSVLFSEDMLPERRLEPINLTMLHGLQNVAGYEPLILERYSRALGDAFLDAVTPRPGYPADNSLLESRSHVLDLLNARFIVSYPDLSFEPNRRIEKEGIRFSSKELVMNLRPGESASLPGVAAESDTLAFVSTLSFAEDVQDGELVGKLRLIDANGRVEEREILAGRDTAEWAHERPDLRSVISHRLAPIFSEHPGGDGEVRFIAYRYWTRVSFGEPLRIARVEFVNVSRRAGLHIVKATLFDSRSRFSMPLPHYDLNKWQPVYDQNDVVILRNQSALPRLWLVAEAEAVDGELALRRIRGESGASFDPRRTALLEMRPENLPRLPGGTVSSSATANLISYTDNRIEIATAAETQTVLVLSEINYPGWIATVDGVNAPIHTADFLLRGIILPAGAHHVEMYYAAPGARSGAIITLFTLLLVAGLGVYTYRREKQRPNEFRSASNS